MSDHDGLDYTALAEAGHDTYFDGGFDRIPEIEQELWRNVARAVVAALREQRAPMSDHDGIDWDALGRACRYATSPYGEHVDQLMDAWNDPKWMNDDSRKMSINSARAVVAAYLEQRAAQGYGEIHRDHADLAIGWEDIVSGEFNDAKGADEIAALSAFHAIADAVTPPGPYPESSGPSPARP